MEKEENFKDKKDINNKTAEICYLNELASICRDAYKTIDPDAVLKKQLIKDDDCKEFKKPQEEHNDCKKCDTDRETEKRICRCMYYYAEKSSKCADCNIKHKWINTGTHSVTEYEIRPKYNICNVGRMDLIIDNTYAAEVKSPKSRETLSRMISETLTYTINSGYKPAIAFFDGSDQSKAFSKFYTGEPNSPLKELLKHVKVFIIYVEYSGEYAYFKIEEFNEKKMAK